MSKTQAVDMSQAATITVSNVVTLTTQELSKIFLKCWYSGRFDAGEANRILGFKKRETLEEEIDLFMRVFNDWQKGRCPLGDDLFYGAIISGIFGALDAGEKEF